MVDNFNFLALMGPICHWWLNSFDCGNFLIAFSMLLLIVRGEGGAGYFWDVGEGLGGIDWLSLGAIWLEGRRLDKGLLLWVVHHLVCHCLG